MSFDLTKPLWMPPMQEVLALNKKYGISGNSDVDPMVFLGDLGIVEHTVHELSHAVLLDLVIDDHLTSLSHAVASEISERASLQQTEETAGRYEVDAIATESLVAQKLGLPIGMESMIDALSIQVGHMFDDYVQRLLDARESERVLDAVDKVCSIVAPNGRGEFREGVEFSRIDRAGREIVVYRMAFGNARLCISEAGSDCYIDAWCYQTEGRFSGLLKAIDGGSQWDGEGNDPPGGWYRNPMTGRRREGGDPSKEHVHW